MAYPRKEAGYKLLPIVGQNLKWGAVVEHPMVNERPVDIEYLHSFHRDSPYQIGEAVGDYVEVPISTLCRDELLEYVDGDELQRGFHWEEPQR